MTLALAALIGCVEPVGPAPELDSPRYSGAGTSALVACPSNETESASAVVDALGGTITVAGHSIMMPAGALPAPTLITVTVPASQYIEVDIQANDLPSFEFEQPVTLTLSYARCNRSDLESKSLRGWYIDAASKQMLQDLGGVEDKSARTVTFPTIHLSTYAIAD